QKEAPSGYKAEVSLSLPISFRETDYILEGRADGVFTENNLLTVDEIKTTGVPVTLITEEFDASHWGQALCYAHILAVTKGLPRIGVRLTYYHVDTGEIKRFTHIETAESLKMFIENLLAEYQKWAEFQIAWRETRTKSIGGLGFPFSEYRKGQREMAALVYRSVQKSLRLFCQAPTGIGKTISTIFPAVKAMGEGFCQRIFYLTAKTITRQAAEEAYSMLRQRGLRMKTVTLTAKDKICFLEERNCNPDACPYADGYYDRARDAVYSLLDEGDNFTRLMLEEKAREFRVCPFELALDISLWCDGVICDYNYLFDPVVALKRFFTGEKGENVFLIDEAHNLVDRAREMYSAELTKSHISQLKNELGKGTGELRRSVRQLSTQMTEVRKSCGEQGFCVEETPSEELCRAALRFSSAASEWLEKYREPTELHGQILNLFFEVSFFLRILEFYGKNYCAFSACRKGETTLKLLCMDPSTLLDERLNKGRAAVFFSATLSPLTYYRDVLGGGEAAKCYSLPSPFPQGNLCLLNAGKISTKYRDRPESLVPIAHLLHSLISGKSGNYLAYFPSYKYLQDVLGAFTKEYPQVNTVVQTGDMDEALREEFLLRFDSENSGTLLGFCVLGGVFSEGVDLKGDRLIGSAVIGVGLPQIGPELDHMREYFNEQCGLGYEYIYRYPGMNKVLQAAGRVIRGGEDRGVVLLIDSRFPTNSYQYLFPSHWNHWKSVENREDLAQKLAEFWNTQNTG
ncbi:MAG: ATP-dependent DNA helicase, partial [Oscillospiraceae bacterium]